MLRIQVSILIDNTDPDGEQTLIQALLAEVVPMAMPVDEGQAPDEDGVWVLMSTKLGEMLEDAHARAKHQMEVIQR